MKNLFSLQKFRDISIKRKLYFIVGAMAVLIVIELVTLWFAIHTLSAVRAFVGAEGLWSKAEKDAVYQLRKYSRTGNEADYNAFQKFMAVPLGDHKTRLELLKPDPDMNVARQGFLQGRIHSDDINGMINLVLRFHNNYYLGKAIGYWSQGDSLITKLIPVGEQLHAEIDAPVPSKQKIDFITGQIEPINEELTTLEDNFSYSLGEGSRWLENLVLKIVFAVALTVEITGLGLSISVTRSITKGLREINKTANKIAKGDLSERVTVFSKDEIGQVAAAMNNMTDKLVLSNEELGHFAYIASHDLQEPLRTISNYVELLQRKYEGKLDENADKYLSVITGATNRMQLLIKDVLDYSRIGSEKILQNIDCNKLLRDVLVDMDAHIKKTNTKIYADALPVVKGYSELSSVFQNLISNAIKFKKENSDPVIHINAVAKNKEWLFSIKDNGIGIEPEYADRIFTIFQKLHSNKIYTGTGIGLAHCKKIIELHRGKIWVESEAGKGSSFYFTISM
jgi:signal transduction histidine kinase